MLNINTEIDHQYHLTYRDRMRFARGTGYVDEFKAAQELKMSNQMHNLVSLSTYYDIKQFVLLKFLSCLRRCLVEP